MPRIQPLVDTAPLLPPSAPCPTAFGRVSKLAALPCNGAQQLQQRPISTTATTSANTAPPHPHLHRWSLKLAQQGSNGGCFWGVPYGTAARSQRLWSCQWSGGLHAAAGLPLCPSACLRCLKPPAAAPTTASHHGAAHVGGTGGTGGTGASVLPQAQAQAGPTKPATQCTARHPYVSADRRAASAAPGGEKAVAGQRAGPAGAGGGAPCSRASSLLLLLLLLLRRRRRHRAAQRGGCSCVSSATYIFHTAGRSLPRNSMTQVLCM